MSRRFKRQVANPLTEISELQVYVDATEGEERVLHVSSEVRIAPAIGEIAGRDFKYGPRRASLKFHISGCEAANRARFNDMPLETVEISEVRREAINNDKSASLTVGDKNRIKLFRISSKWRIEECPSDQYIIGDPAWTNNNNEETK